MRLSELTFQPGDISMGKSDKSYEGEHKSLKVRLYFMSLSLLFFLVFLLTVDIPISFAHGAKFVGWVELLQRNMVAFPAALLMAASIFIAKNISYQWKGATNIPFEVEEVKNENYEYLTFLTTYIIPLICIDLENMRYVVVLVLLLIVIGYIFVKMDLYYGNPTLALLGYRIYRAKVKGVTAPDGVILICKGCVTKGASIKWIEIDKLVWVAKEIENER